MYIYIYIHTHILHITHWSCSLFSFYLFMLYTAAKYIANSWLLLYEQVFAICNDSINLRKCSVITMRSFSVTQYVWPIRGALPPWIDTPYIPGWLSFWSASATRLWCHVTPGHWLVRVFSLQTLFIYCKPYHNCNNWGIMAYHILISLERYLLYLIVFYSHLILLLIFIIWIHAK